MKGFHDSLLYIKDNSKYFLLAAGIFFFFFILGLMFPGRVSYYQLLNLDFGNNIFLFILRNNLSVAIMAMLGGLFFGVIPFFIATMNGYVVGMVIAVSLRSMSLFEVMLKFLPHGIIEIAGIIVSIGFGLSYANFFFKKRTLREMMFDATDLFLNIVLPLILISAIIESLLIVNIAAIMGVFGL